MTDSVSRQRLPVPLAYRHIDRAQVLAQLIHALVTGGPPDQKRLTTKSLSDPTVALLNGWATVADVIDFYQERIATESYLTTATEPESVLALAKLLGYRPRPGLAATCWLAYTLVADPTDTAVLLPKHQLVQSVPGAGELPQTFETSEDLVARPSWNTLPVKTTAPLRIPTVVTGDTTQYAVPEKLMIAGAVAPLKPNDVVLITPTAATAKDAVVLAVRAADVKADLLANTATVVLQQPQQSAQRKAAGPPPDAPPADVGDAIGALVGPLTKSPSVPPATATAVPRDLEKIFPKGAGPPPGMTAKMLAALHPGLAKALYPALATSTIGKPDVGSVQTLRVTTTPFGVQVPPRARFDSQGRPQTPEEWPIGDSQTLTITLTARRWIDRGSTDVAFTELSDFPATVRIDGPGYHDAITIDNGNQTPFASGAGTIEVTKEGALKFTAEPHSGLEDTIVTPKAGELTATTGAGGPGVTAALDATWSAVSESSSGLSISLRLLPRLTTDAPIWLVIEVVSALPLSDDDRKILYLNERHDEIVPGSVVMIDAGPDNKADNPLLVDPPDDEPFYPRVTQVVDAAAVTINRYGMSQTVTRLQLRSNWIRAAARLLSDLRPLSVHAQPVDLNLLQAPIDAPVAGREIGVTGLHPGIDTGHRLVLTGTRADLVGDASVQAGETLMVAGVSQISDNGEPPYTNLTLATALSYSYRPDTVTLYGNVVPAHHGATITENMTPAGDPAHPVFTLAQSPVLADPSGTQTGFSSTLTLVIDGRTWTWVPRLDSATPPRSYITGTDGQGHTTITLSQPVPYPASTVIATYRSAVGSAGNLRAGQLTQPLTRPLAVATVTNPLPASGGSDPDGPETVRIRAPLGLEALGRVVSVQDAADIALTWAGIGKTAATLTTDGTGDIVAVTVAGVSPTPLDPHGTLISDLRAALTAAGDVTVPIVVTPAAISLIALIAQIHHDPDISWNTVEPAVRAELTDAYGYDHRGIDEDIIISDLIAVIHRVDGVRSCAITQIGQVDYDITAKDLATFILQTPPPDDPRIPVTGVAYISDTVADTLILQEA